MKIVIAEEESVVRSMLETTLPKWGYEVVTASDGAHAWQELQKGDGTRLAILDRTLPGMDGLEICRQARRRIELPYIYILLLLAKGQEQDMLEGMKAGADDILLKPLDLNELMIRLRLAKRVLELQEQLQSAHAAIGYQTTHDPLTGLANRASILDTLLRELARVRREGSHVGLILAEIDNFKHINETHGHLAGDAVLREAARRLRATVRPYDNAGRYGAEEFLIVAPGCDAANALSQAERIRTAMGGQSMDISEWGKFASAQEGKIHVTLSLGVATGDKLKETEPLLRAVEAARARAQKAGRNRIELAKPEDFK
jgi:diguanylate cyclase (GGDEF)-like protein